jgi:hypothetical protein
VVIGYRNAMSSLLDMESRHNRLLEEKILLEEELITKGKLEEDVQRLKDELRGRLPSVSSSLSSEH